MAQLISDRRDVDFVLHEQFGLVDHDKFAEFNKKTVDLIVSEARNLAIKEILPTQKPGDEEGCVLENGVVKVPECFKRAWELYKEGEWLAMTDDPEVGGQGMPKMVGIAASEYLVGANSAFMLYSAMTHGAAKLVEAFGTEEQKALYMKKMFSGEWGGTMLLTEPEAGSDVGALTTSATLNDDGTYSITGSKIFISAGEHDLCENIIHPVLARIEGSPEGTKGISLFLVPKYLVNEDGSLGDFNNVVCTGIEEKMGIHGNATCTLSLGEKGKSIGTLLGEINKGMPEMFKMMNEARAFVGLQGFGVATASYMYSLDYARTRIQGRHMVKGREPGAKSVPIIQHPDVRRQLLNMKAMVDGMRSLLYLNGKCSDLMVTAESDEEREKYSDLVEVLTPIVKGYVTDKALEVCSHGIQIYGGYGYIKEFPVEQLMRDSRIFMIYEGTNGIQAMDLLGRKLSMKKGRSFGYFIEWMEKTIQESKSVEGIENITASVESAKEKFVSTAKILGDRARSADVMNAFSFAHPFLEVTGDVTMAWMLLWRAMVAAPKLVKKAGSLESSVVAEKAGKNKDVAFYAGQIRTAEFFINTLLPSALAKMDAIVAGDRAVEEMPEASFGSK
ncbi:Acd10 [Desulfamplus magnetovallimortis]|uniref:3-methylmercaptopropionyl-CoA dehydrogenase n=1 Tax=Desulfamplus magnetovallimortis TaxID=1246637 RepID=A0A1W1H599_9BACT|nr:acyl-CoA dehydrogenase C-terminal domain-containing protein [Desulfamplus magnetovallimortis]SLM27659.1 Acd10 [Desulfamplus magnetovallimortis]